MSARTIALVSKKTGKWILSARETPGEPLEPQITDLLANTTAELSVWRSLAKRFRVRFVVGAWIRSWNRGLEISPRLLRMPSDRDLGLGVDIYVDYDEGSAH